MNKADIIKILLGIILTLITSFSAFKTDVIKENQEKTHSLLEKHIDKSGEQFIKIRENYLMKKDFLVWQKIK